MAGQLTLKHIIIGMVLLSVVVSSLGFWFFIKQQGKQVGKDYIPPEEAKEVVLYFAVEQSSEFIEKKIQIHKDLDLQTELKRIIEKMGQSSYISKKAQWWPKPLQVRSAYQRKNGLLILDFEKGVKYNRKIGSFEEQLLIKSLVKTVLSNYNEFEELKLLVSGQEAESLAGHVDIIRTYTLKSIEW